MKKILSLILAVTLLLVLGASTYAADNTDISGKTIGLINAGPDDYYYRVFDVYEALAKQMGWKVTFLNSEYSPEKEIANVQDLIVRGVDAIAIITANAQAGGRACKIANDYGVPIFFICGKPDESTGGVPDGHVTDDFFGLGYMNGEWVAANHPDAKVVTIDGFYGQGTCEALLEGFQQALDDHNTGIEAVSVGSGEWQRTKAIPVAQDLLASGRDFDLVYVLNEEMVAGVLQVFEEQGVDDKIIISTNGKEECMEWIKDGKVAATSPNPPSLNAHLSFQQMVKYFKGEPYKRYLRIYYDGMITKENVASAIPWKKDAYLAGVEADSFTYKLSDYEVKMEARQSQ